MKNVILFEDAGFANLLPILYWRSVFEVRCGRGTMVDRITHAVGAGPTGLWTRAWIAPVAAERLNLPVNQPIKPGDVLVNGRWFPDDKVTLVEGPLVATCDGDIAHVVCDERLAEQLGPEHFLDPDGQAEWLDAAPKIEATGSMIRYPWDIVNKSAESLAVDWDPSSAGVAGDVHHEAILINTDTIRIDDGAVIAATAVIDATAGPIVIETGVTVGPHVTITGPAHIAARSVVNPGAHIHGGTSIGSGCKIGGEIDACVFQGYANKQHDGFLGHSFVGNWVNLGASTVNSDLKNTYSSVRVLINGEPVNTGQPFVGAIIGDHTKTAIRTTIPTGAVIGFAVNAACGRTLPAFVRSFSWLTDRGLDEGDPDRLVATAATAMQRRQQDLTEAESALFAKLPQIVAYFEPAIAAQKQAFKAASAPDPRRIAQPEGPTIQ